MERLPVSVIDVNQLPESTGNSVRLMPVIRKSPTLNSTERSFTSGFRMMPDWSSRIKLLFWSWLIVSSTASGNLFGMNDKVTVLLAVKPPVARSTIV